MDLEYFPHFIRKNFPEYSETDEQFIEIGKEFKTYLLKMFKGEEDKLESIWDISPKTIIINDGNPLKINGYEPILLIYWLLFIKLLKIRNDD